MDENPNGELTETPTDSQPETITTGEGETVNQDGAATQAPEEASWNGLSGSSQDRFKQMAKKLNEAISDKQRLERLAEVGGTVPMPPVNKPELNAEARDAVRKLNEDFGIATKDDVDRTVDDKIQRSIGGLIYSFELDKLESRFDGANGLPAFSKDEYEAYVATHPEYRNYKPEDVYRKMFPTEILAYEVKNYGKAATQRTSPSLKPTKTQVAQEQWTPEAVESRLNQPDGPEWYDKNQSLVNTVLARTSQE